MRSQVSNAVGDYIVLKHKNIARSTRLLILVCICAPHALGTSLAYHGLLFCQYCLLESLVVSSFYDTYCWFLWSFLGYPSCLGLKHFFVVLAVLEHL
jgi:hypothetical protein